MLVLLQDEATFTILVLMKVIIIQVNEPVPRGQLQVLLTQTPLSPRSMLKSSFSSLTVML